VIRGPKPEARMQNGRTAGPPVRAVCIYPVRGYFDEKPRSLPMLISPLSILMLKPQSGLLQTQAL